MRVAVIGGGIFGTTAAIALAESGHEVHLYEKNSGLFQAASGINQYRLHGGYHYPRAPETVKECQEGLASFRKVYGKAITSTKERYYAIAARGSKVSPAKYIKFLDKHGLKHKVEKPITKSLALLLRVEEECVDPIGLRNIAFIKLAQVGVECHYNTRANSTMRDQFDQIVFAGYASTNELAIEFDCAVEPLQFEVCEKPVIKLSDNYRQFSLVVMDGPFCSLDPMGSTGCHVMGHVEHAIHKRSFGLEPDIDFDLEGDLNGGIVRNPKRSKYKQMIKSSKRFMPFLEEAKYQGSMFVIRTVLPDRDKTDERPTLVDRLDDQVVRIFSGKIGTAVLAARTTLEIVESSQSKTHPKQVSAA